MREKENIASKNIIHSFQFFGIQRSPENSSTPVLSKQSLHNYFAEKMAAFSIIVRYIIDQLQQVIPQKEQLSNPLVSLHNKLGMMQRNFLNRYHQLTSRTGSEINAHVDLLQPIFEHINLFEKKMISEVLDAGIRREELQGFSSQNLVFIPLNK